MDFFDKLGETIVSAGKDVGQKAKDVSEVAKLKMDIRSKEDFVEKQYAALGKIYFEEHKDETECEQSEQIFLIKEALEEVERMKAEVLKIQGSTECPSCGAKMPEDAAFCSNCGTKLNDIFEELYNSNDEDFLSLIKEYTLKSDKDIFEFILNINNKLDLKTNKKSYLDNYIEDRFNETTINKDIDTYIKEIFNIINKIHEYLEYI